MRVRNYAAKPMAEITASKRIDTGIWDIRGFDRSMLVEGFTLRCDATLEEPPGKIRIGWNMVAHYESQRIAGNVFNKECLLPLVTFVIQSGTWTMTRPARRTGMGGCDHTCHRPGLFRRRHRALLSGLGVAA